MPSEVTGSSHICANGCPAHSGFTHPALAGGAAVISPPAVTMPASAVTTYRFMVLLSRRVSGSVVDVRRRVIEGEAPRVQVKTHRIAAVADRAVGQAATAIRLVKYHATLPGAVRLDGSIALADNESCSVLAARAGRGAEPISYPAISAAASPPAMYCFMSVSLYIAAGNDTNGYVCRVCCV
jgi:hypothetical protein